MADAFEAPRSRWRTRLVPVVVGVVLALVAGIAAYVLVDRAGATASGAADANPDELAPVIELYEALTSDAVDAPDREALIEGAIDGMLGEVDDRYAEFYPPEAFADFNANLDGTFSGVGLMLADTPDGHVIVSVLDDTPAQEAGIETGERIVEVDGDDVSEDPLENVVAKVKGEAGTRVSLGLAGGDAGRRTVEIVRAEFDLPLVASEMLDGEVGYVQLYQFSDDAGATLRAEVESLLDDGAEAIVLDLRGNPGGLLNEAVEVASVFIEDGEIVSVEERGGEREALDAVDDAFDEVPLAVLIDGASASASEIVAGAVQDADRGVLVGEQSFGKGTVQTIARFGDGSGAKFTTARYFTPSGDSIEGVGVKPEIVVELDERPAEAADDDQVQAAVDELTGELQGAGR